MIGRHILTAASLLPLLVLAAPNELAKHPTIISAADNNNENDILGSGKLAHVIATICRVKEGDWADRLPDTNEVCASLNRVAKELNDVESATFCNSTGCAAKYDPSSALCLCSWGRPDQMKEDNVWPDKHCNETIACYGPFEAHFNPDIDDCSCAIETFHPDGITTTYPPNNLESFSLVAQLGIKRTKSVGHENTTVDANLKHLVEKIQELEKQLVIYQIAAQHSRFVAKVSKLFRKHLHEAVENRNSKPAHVKINSSSSKEQVTHVGRSPASSAVSLSPLPTYIPPPDTEVTQELLQQSLLLQPQQLAVVGSAIPHFADGIISFHVQLDGPVSQTLVLNATDTLPCENIGSESPPSLIVVPKTVKNGTSETVLATCLIIAVNIYDPKYITYWIQNEVGAVYTLLSDNKIHAIDQLDTSQPANVEIRVATPIKNAERDVYSTADIRPLKRRQIFSIACNSSCPFPHMRHIQGSDGYCGCLFRGAEQSIDLTTRGVEQPTQYTATMTAEACAAMTCINNGGKPALFNPFTATCWCTSPKFVEVNDNAYDGGL